MISRADIAPLMVTFTNQSSRTQTITSYLWSLGDGPSASTLQHPTHQYTALGVYTVGLTITSGLQADCLVRPSYITVTNPVNAQFTASRSLAMSR